MVSAGRNEKLPLTHRQQLERFGTVSVRTHRQALSGLSWLSSSPSSVLRPIAEPGYGPVACVAAHELPTPAQVERSSLGNAPMDRAPWGDLHPLDESRPVASESDETGMSSSPRLLLPSGASSDRTPGFDPADGVVLRNRGLVRRASVEPDEHLSTHPALREHTVAGSESAPLGRW